MAIRDRGEKIKASRPNRRRILERRLRAQQGWTRAQQGWTWERAVRRMRVPLGFVFAAAFLLFARPSIPSLARSLLLVVPGLLLRAYASGYVKKNAELTTAGPYAQTRNPLYLGSLIAALGFVAASRNSLLVLAFCVLFSAVYLPVIWSEERFLQANFSGFTGYMQRVPRLFPRSFVRRAQQSPAQQPQSPAQQPQSPAQQPQSPAQQPQIQAQQPGSFSAALYRHHREYNAGVGAAAIYAALLLLLQLRQHGIIPGQ